MSENNPFNLSNHIYDLIKNITLMVLPGLATLWITLGTIWGLPYTNEIAGTITALALFGGVFVGVSKKKFDQLPVVPESVSTDGDLLVDLHDGTQSMTVALERPLDDLRDQETVAFRVIKTGTQE